MKIILEYRIYYYYHYYYVQTLNSAYFSPLFLLHEQSLEFGADGHMIYVIQHDADHVSCEMLQPRD